MPAACSVLRGAVSEGLWRGGREGTYEMNPQIMADVAMRAMILARDGASAPSTPIWMPSEPRFAKPARAYDAMVKPRSESGLSDFWIEVRFLTFRREFGPHTST